MSKSRFDLSVWRLVPFDSHCQHPGSRLQTHKVCANHFLQPGMELNSMKNQPRAVIWAAKDFAGEHFRILSDVKYCWMMF